MILLELLLSALNGPEVARVGTQLCMCYGRIMQTSVRAPACAIVTHFCSGDLTVQHSSEYA
jgi:hypothetical protein